MPNPSDADHKSAPWTYFPAREDPLAFGKPTGWNVDIRILKPAQAVRRFEVGEIVPWDAAQFLTGAVGSWMQPTGRTHGDYPPASYREWHSVGWIEGWLNGANAGLPDASANSRCYMPGGTWPRFDELGWQPLLTPELLVTLIRRRAIPSQSHIRSAAFLSRALGYLHRDYDLLLGLRPATSPLLDHLEWCARSVAEAHRRLLELDPGRVNITPTEPVEGWNNLAQSAHAIAMACIASNPALVLGLPPTPTGITGYGSLKTYVFALKAAVAASRLGSHRPGGRTEREAAEAQTAKVHVPPAAQLALDQYDLALQVLPGHPKDREAFELLRRRPELKRLMPEVFETWQRHLRKGRRLTGRNKHTSRSGRGAGGSIVREGEI